MANAWSPHNGARPASLNTFSPGIAVGGLNTKTQVKQLSRALAAYALQLEAQLTPEEAARSVTDGAQDNGLDAIHADAREKRLYLVQSKWIESGKGEPDLASVRKFAGGIVDLINLNFNRFNDAITRRQDEIVAALEDPSFRLTIVLAYTGISGLAKDSNEHLRDLLSDFNDANEVVELSILKQEKLHAGLLSKVKGEPVGIDITMSAFGKKTEPYTAWYGQVSASDIAKWWQDYRERLFVRNLRGLLYETDINLDIRKSLHRNPTIFWYLNNGITLVAESIERPLAHAGTTEFVTLRCKNVSVVNGAQTVGTIGRVGQDPLQSLEGITVMVRVIDLAEAEPDFGQMITRSNNRQNRIESRDFVALDPEQQRLQDELALEGISYQLLRSGDFSPSDTGFDVVESTIALACANGDGAIAIQVKREISKLWESLDARPYRSLFNAGVDGPFVWRCVQIQRRIDRSIKEQVNHPGTEDEIKGVLTHGNRMIAALIFSSIPRAKIQQTFGELDDIVPLEEIRSQVMNLADELRHEIVLRFPKKPFPTIFKNVSNCKELLESSRQGSTFRVKQLRLDFGEP